MAIKNQVLDMTPAGMKFTVLETAADTGGGSLDLHWELLPCRVLDKLTDNRTKDFKMNLKTMLYMSVLMNNYRHEIISKSPPDGAIKFLGFISKIIGIHY